MAEALDNLLDEIQEQPTSIHDLKLKMRLEGTVTRVELFGAFVDIGVGQEGLVHISQLSPQRVNRVTEIINEGDTITVWVIGIEPSRKRINLTLIEPAGVDWGEIRSGQVYSGTIKRLERFGAFVDIGATRDGLVHVSEITSDYIQDPKEYLKVGDEVQVKVLQVDQKKRRIELSIKALEDHLIADEHDEEFEEAPTALELAWRQATGKPTKKRRQQKRKKAHQQRRYPENDIFSRTLDLRED